MTEQRDAAATVDVVGLLMRQNYYQRLGLKTDAVQPAEINEAYHHRLRILDQCQNELSSEVAEKAQHLVDEAYAVLSDSARRLEYDRYLENLQRWRGTPPVNQARCVDAQPDMIRGRYKLGNVLHEGKRARIFDAEDTSLNREVIVKQVRGEFLRIADYQRMFRDEAERFARFTSGNLVKVLDYDPALGALVMEKMSSDLRGALVKKGCSHAFAMDVLRDTLGGLCELHAEGLVHGRVDMSHIMLDDHGSAKLAVTPGFGNGQRALLPGTESIHLAPELLNPEVFGEVKHAADIYSLGFIILELMVGKSFAQSVSASISQGEKYQSAWLQWHASPTDHLPSIEMLVPGLPAAFCNVLKRMTCKQQHERYASASECLQQLKTIQANAECETEMFPINPEITETGSVQILGSPDPLHGRYQAPTEIGWMEIAKNPALLMKPEAKRQRIFVFSLAAVAAMMLLLISSGGNNHSNERKVASIVDEPPAESDLSLAVDEYTQEQLEPYPDDEPNSTDQTPTEPSSNSCSVTFLVLPAGEITSVTGSGEMQQLSQNVWDLAPGTYTIRYKVYENQQDLDASVDVPKDTPQMTIVLQTKTLKERPTPVIAPTRKELTEDPDKIPTHIRSRTIFSLVGLNKEEFEIQDSISNNLADYFRDVSLNHPRKISDLENRANSPRRRDPRISFAYALQANRNGNQTLALEQCYRALRESEEFGVPFVVPLELLCHVEFQESGKGLQNALAACRDTFNWVQSHQQRHPENLKFRGALEDVVWWTGIVTAYIEHTRDENTRAHVNVENTRVEMEAQLDPELKMLLRSAIKAVSLKQKRLLTDHQRRTEILAEQEQARAERAEQIAKEKRRSENKRMGPQVYGLPGAQTGNPTILSSISLNSSGLQTQDAERYGPAVFVPSGSQYDNSEQTFVGPRISPYQFSHYEACDIRMFAECARFTIPSPSSTQPRSPNKSQQ